MSNISIHSHEFVALLPTSSAPTRLWLQPAMSLGLPRVPSSTVPSAFEAMTCGTCSSAYKHFKIPAFLVWSSASTLNRLNQAFQINGRYPRLDYRAPNVESTPSMYHPALTDFII